MMGKHLVREYLGFKHDFFGAISAVTDGLAFLFAFASIKDDGVTSEHLARGSHGFPHWLEDIWYQWIVWNPPKELGNLQNLIMLTAGSATGYHQPSGIFLKLLFFEQGQIIWTIFIELLSTFRSTFPQVDDDKVPELVAGETFEGSVAAEVVQYMADLVVKTEEGPPEAVEKKGFWLCLFSLF